MTRQTASSVEQTDVNVRRILWAGVILALVVLVAALGVGGYHRALAAHFPAARTRHWAPPAPRLQTDPNRDLAAWRLEEDAQLTSYGWINRGAGVIRIPITRAMELTLERKLPARDRQP